MTDAPGVQPANGAAPDAGVQPGQGQPDGAGLYDLESVPPELRDVLTPHLKAIEGNVTKKFQEAAEYRKQWEPYEELGLTDMDPQDLSALLELQDVFSDEDSLRGWWEQLGEYMGFADQAPEEDGAAEDGEGIDLSSIEEVIGQRLDERLAPLLEAQRSQEEQQRIADVEQQLEGQLKTMHDEHGEFDEDVVLRLALAYDEQENPLELGFRDYQELIAQAEKGLLGKKMEQPATPEGAGMANTNSEPVTDFETAKQLARERIRQSRVA